MSTPSTVMIGEHQVGFGAPVLVIAEAGVNHDGELAIALELVDAAAKAGADAVKFQTFDPQQLASSDAEMASYQRSGEQAPATQREMLNRLRLSVEDFQAIAHRCRERDILFLSTPFDSGSAALLVQLGVPAFKIGSGEVTNLPFLEELAGIGLPLLLSTGMATLDEVGDAVAAVRLTKTSLVLLHCTSSYPASPKEANLRAIDTMREAFDVPVGYSDHTLGLDVSLAAVARDCCLLERHLTLDRRRRGPDHAMSLEPSELEELVCRVRDMEVWLGDGIKQPQPTERELLTVARRSIVAARPLAAGETLTREALAIKRPGGGIPPARLNSLIGTRLARPIGIDEQLAETHLEARP